jgi:hypothetical protein
MQADPDPLAIEPKPEKRENRLCNCSIKAAFSRTMKR